MKKTITIGIPCFNEEKNIIKTYQKILKMVSDNNKYFFKFIIVDNGSTDNTKALIRNLAMTNKNVLGIFLSRDFGPEASVQALIDHASGDAFIGIPADLQDPPKLIPKFIKKWEQGNNIVIGIYTNSVDDFFTFFLRKAFYRLFKKISNIVVPINASGVGLLDKKALNALRMLPEKYRFFRGLRSWI